MRQYRCTGPCGSLLLADDALTPSSSWCGQCNEAFGVQGGGMFSEADWLACPDTRALFLYLRGRTSDRKERLFACAYCRRRPLMRYDRLRQAVETAEYFADGLADPEELAAAAHWARTVWHEHVRRSGPPARLSWTAEAYWAQTVANCLEYPAPTMLRMAQAEDLSALHDLFGNPFRRAAVDPSWLARNDGAAEKVARAIYDGRRFGDLPILGDALEEAGCTDAAILGHGRQPGEHVRGCWLVDALLDRE